MIALGRRIAAADFDGRPINGPIMYVLHMPQPMIERPNAPFELQPTGRKEERTMTDDSRRDHTTESVHVFGRDIFRINNHAFSILREVEDSGTVTHVFNDCVYRIRLTPLELFDLVNFYVSEQHRDEGAMLPDHLDDLLSGRHPWRYERLDERDEAIWKHHAARRNSLDLLNEEDVPPPRLIVTDDEGES